MHASDMILARILEITVLHSASIQHLEFHGAARLRLRFRDPLLRGIFTCTKCLPGSKQYVKQQPFELLLHTFGVQVDKPKQFAWIPAASMPATRSSSLHLSGARMVFIRTLIAKRPAWPLCDITAQHILNRSQRRIFCIPGEFQVEPKLLFWPWSIWGSGWSLTHWGPPT